MLAWYEAAYFKSWPPVPFISSDQYVFADGRKRLAEIPDTQLGLTGIGNVQQYFLGNNSLTQIPGENLQPKAPGNFNRVVLNHLVACDWPEVTWSSTTGDTTIFHRQHTREGPAVKKHTLGEQSGLLKSSRLRKSMI